MRIGAAPTVAASFEIGHWLHGDARSIQFKAQGGGVFTCTGGRSIVITPDPDARESLLELYCLGTALGIIHYQRGDFPIHGAFVSRNGLTFGICGHSGEGKSTLAYALAQAGCTLLTDDVAIIRSVDGTPTVFAENTHLKLWGEAARSLGVATDGLDPIDGRQDKYYVPTLTREPGTPPALDAMVYLESRPDAQACALEPLPLVAALAQLREQIYRPFLIPPLGLDRQQLEFGAGVAGRVRSFRFIRPRALVQLQEGAGFLLKGLADGLR